MVGDVSESEDVQTDTGGHSLKTETWHEVVAEVSNNFGDVEQAEANQLNEITNLAIESTEIQSCINAEYKKFRETAILDEGTSESQARLNWARRFYYHTVRNYMAG